MLAQVLTVALLIVSSVAGKPPVANFGRPFPAIEFWSVPELRAALQHLFGAGATTAKRLAGAALHGRASDVWLVVISACLSMYGYFRSFYRSVLASRAERHKAESASDRHGAGLADEVRSILTVRLVEVLVNRVEFARNEANASLQKPSLHVCFTRVAGAKISATPDCDLRFRMRVGSIRILSECAICTL